MRIIPVAASLLPLAITLTACTGSPPRASQGQAPKKPAYFAYIDDVSSSPATMNDPVVVQAAERRIGEEMTKEVQLGDTITVYEAGARSADRMVAHPPIVTDYNLRVPAARARLLQQLREVATGFHARGGDKATNLLLTLEAARPQCTPRSTVTLVTDGVEESDTYSAAKALRAGKAVNLPPPPGKYLAGCHIQLLGFGLTTELSAGKAQLLPARHLAALRQGWTAYLRAAGVRPDDIDFVSVL